MSTVSWATVRQQGALVGRARSRRVAVVKHPRNPEHRLNSTPPAPSAARTRDPGSVVGPQHPEVARSMKNLANVHCELAQFDDCLKLHESALLRITSTWRIHNRVGTFCSDWQSTGSQVGYENALRVTDPSGPWNISAYAYLGLGRVHLHKAVWRQQLRHWSGRLSCMRPCW